MNNDYIKLKIFGDILRAVLKGTDTFQRDKPYVLKAEDYHKKNFSTSYGYARIRGKGHVYFPDKNADVVVDIFDEFLKSKSISAVGEFLFNNWTYVKLRVS